MNLYFYKYHASVYIYIIYNILFEQKNYLLSKKVILSSRVFARERE